MNLKLQKKLGYGGSKHVWRRGSASWLSRVLAKRGGGGLVFLEDDEVLKRLREQLGLPGGPALVEYEKELLRDEALERAFERSKAHEGADPDASWAARVRRLRGVATVYYALLREVKPEVIVETGTAAGGYSAFAIAALAHNDKGRLISIDLPPVQGKLQMAMTVSDENVGYYIPTEYHDRWEYRKGDAKVLLPQVLREVDADVFIHDSLHTVTHMMFEYSVARALMKNNALILSDDIMWNRAFQSFLSANGLIGYSPYSRPNTGVCVSSFDDFEQRSGLGVVESVDSAG